MKSSLILILVGALIGATFHYFYTAKQSVPITPPPTATVAERARVAAVEAEASTVSTLNEWRLNATDLRNDLATTGRVVRQKPPTDNATAPDARIAATIKGQYLTDEELSKSNIKVACEEGRVTLHGQVENLETLGTALRLALETDGVATVESRLLVVNHTL